MTERISFARKFMACLILSFLSVDTVLLLGTPPRGAWISDRFVFGCALFGLAIPLLGLPVWEYRERRKTVDSLVVSSRMHAWISYLTGFCISIFGWKKLFHLQFRTPLSIADLPMSSHNGETLTWYYFGHSYTFDCIIGIIQISGAILLFSRRTRFAGALLLFPVMLNILLINIFYKMNAGALLQSILLTLGLLYIILLQYRDLISLLYPRQVRREPVDNSGRGVQWRAAGLISLLAFLFVLDLSHSRTLPVSPIYGRYRVQEMSVNGTHLSTTGSFNKDSMLTKVYFDVDNVCVLEYNSPDRRLLAKYALRKDPGISDSWNIDSRFVDNGKEVVLTASVSAESEDRILLRGWLSGDWITLVLYKVM